jgi:ABC-type molybdate transport system substrate-binding protein
LALAVGSVALAGLLIVSLATMGRGSNGGSARTLTLFCAAGLRQPVGQIVADYQQECGVEVQVDYGDCKAQVGQIEAGRPGDLFLVDDRKYAELARQKGLAEEILPVAAGKPIILCVLTGAQDPSAALRFARYLTARDRGLPAFASAGYEVPEGDLWAEVPQLTFFVGVVVRPAIEETVKAFAAREGVVVNTVYNGCGILNAQIRGSRHRESRGLPDLYMVGDVTLLEPVQEHFQDEVEISQTEVVMVVAKGNPKGIRRLQDLTRKDIRVVVGHPRQCTVGIFTQRILREQGLYDEVMKNVAAQMPTAALLIPAVSMGSADVALSWNTDARAESHRVDVIRFDSQYNTGIQTLAIGRSSNHKELAGRLRQAITASQAKFESAGFGWRLPRPARAVMSKTPFTCPGNP